MSAVPASDAPVTPQVTGASPRPLLSGPVRDRALRLAEALSRPRDPGSSAGHQDASLASGAAGLAVCSGQLARSRASQHAVEAALARLEEAIAIVATEPLTSSLYSGFVGVAWAVELVDQILGTGGQDGNADIDDALTRLLQRYPEHAPYDLTDGLTGLGVYALARWPRPSAAQCAVAVVEQLARRARHDRKGVYWLTSPSSHRGLGWPGGVDLGVAHGMAGVIPFLARAHSLGLAPQTVRPLLDGAVSWLLANMIHSASGPTVPYFVAKGVAAAPSRSAWCHGDPGVAAALLLAAREAGEPGWTAVATELAVQAAIRPPEQAGVADAGLCHGSAGLAHLFHRMYQMTGEPVLADAARFWVERTIDLCSAMMPGEDAVPARLAFNGPGLLEGAAGVTLALEAASTTVEPAWDQMLLVSSTGAFRARGKTSGSDGTGWRR